MHKKQVVLGRTYIAKVSRRLTKVLLLSESVYGGWIGRNVSTGREVHIRSAARLRWEVESERDDVELL